MTVPLKGTEHQVWSIEEPGMNFAHEFYLHRYGTRHSVVQQRNPERSAGVLESRRLTTGKEIISIFQEWVGISLLLYR